MLKVTKPLIFGIYFPLNILRTNKLKKNSSFFQKSDAMTVHLIYQPTCEISGAFHFPNDIPKYKKLSVKIIA